MKLVDNEEMLELNAGAVINSVSNKLTVGIVQVQAADKKSKIVANNII